MSILQRRIIAHGGQGNHAQASLPYGTSATPMVMPASELTYAGDTAIYGTMQPMFTADGGVIFAQSQARRTWRHPAPVVPASRP